MVLTFRAGGFTYPAFAIYRKNYQATYYGGLLKSLNSINLRYCILKGVVLEKDLFLGSARECNDTDILIHIQDLCVADQLLSQLGYQRGVYNARLHCIESDRKADIFSVMNTHQTTPYRKLSDDPLIKFDTIDLQFEYTLQKKLKYDVDIGVVLDNRLPMNIYHNQCYTLNAFDTFLMLCTHLYGEAILIQEINKQKDLQLTKFADIYEWIEKYYEIYDWNEKICYIVTHGLLKPVLFCIYIIANIYDSSFAKKLYEMMGEHDLGFIDEYRTESFEVKKWKIPVLERIFDVRKDKTM